jgi:hypothetical protein
MSSIMDRLDEMLSEEHDLSTDQKRMAYIRKVLNLKESEKIKDVSDDKLVKMVEMHGYPAKIALEKYGNLCEEVSEKERIAKIMKMLNVKNWKR